MNVVGFDQPDVVKYNSNSSPIELFATYESFFKTTNSLECPITGLILYDINCVDVKAQTDVALEASPYRISAITTNKYGYTHEFCVVAKVEPAGSISPISVK